MKKKTARIICAILVLAGLWIVADDTIDCTLGLPSVWQYAFNAVYLCTAPLLIYGSGWYDYVRRLNNNGDARRS